MGSGLVPLEGSVPFRQSLVYCPRGGLALAFHHCVPFWLDACQALRWGGLWHWVQAWYPWKVRCRFGRRLCNCPGKRDLHLRAITVPFWLGACVLSREEGVHMRPGLVGSHTAMALDLGRSVVSCLCQLGVLVFRRSRIPRVGWRMSSKSRRLSLASCTPFGVALSCSAQVRTGSLSRVKPLGGAASGIGFRPGTLGGFGAVSAARLCIVPGETCTCVLPLCALLAGCLSGS